MSSLTLTDFEDSFFADAVDSKFQLSGWDEEKDKESTDEHEFHPASTVEELASNWGQSTVSILLSLVQLPLAMINQRRP